MNGDGGPGFRHQTQTERPGIAAAVIVEDGQVLMVRRRVREGLLSWQFPAGEVEAGEQPQDGAVREAWEEVGLAVRVTGGLGWRVHPESGRVIHYFACDVVGGVARVVDADELAEVAWCGREALAHYVPYPLHAAVQEHLSAVVVG